MKVTSESLIKLKQIMETVMLKIEPEFKLEIEAGITGRQYVIMKLLNHENLTLNELAEHLGINPKDIKFIIGYMCRSGWVSRDNDEADMSLAKFSLTEKGLVALNKCWGKTDDLITKIFQVLGEANQAKLVHSLSKILA